LRNYCLNHVTTASMSFRKLVKTAASVGCRSIEVRNDLNGELFDGESPEVAQAIASEQGLQIAAIAEVTAFNDGSRRAFGQLQVLADMATRCGASGISLIPWLAKSGSGSPSKSSRAEISEKLGETLNEFAPILSQHKLIGFIEPLGFKHASLRYKADVIAAIKEQNLMAEFQLVHDTFHHFVAQESALFPEHTAMVHISGVNLNHGPRETLVDTDRSWVKAGDRLENLEQLRQLAHGGYQGPISIEAFAPSVHNVQNPEEELLACFNHIGPSLQTIAA